MRQRTILSAGALAAAVVAAPALASPGVTTSDVNMRADATVNSPRLTTIPGGAAVEVHGCPTWCSVTYGGITGWVSPNYIATAEYRAAPAPPAIYYERPAPVPYYYQHRYPRPYGYDDDWRYRRGPGISFEFGL